MIKILVLSLLALTMVVLTPIGMANTSNDDEQHHHWGFCNTWISNNGIR